MGEERVESRNEITVRVGTSIAYTVIPFIVICLGLTHLIDPEVRLKWADGVAVSLAFFIAVRGLYKDNRPIMKAINLNAVGSFAVINVIYFIHLPQNAQSSISSIITGFAFFISALVYDIFISRKSQYGLSYSLTLVAHLLFVSSVTTITALSLF